MLEVSKGGCLAPEQQQQLLGTSAATDSCGYQTRVFSAWRSQGGLPRDRVCYRIKNVSRPPRDRQERWRCERRLHEV